MNIHNLSFFLKKKQNINNILIPWNNKIHECSPTSCGLEVVARSDKRWINKETVPEMQSLMKHITA